MRRRGCAALVALVLLASVAACALGEASEYAALRRGSFGEAVERLQERLWQLGYLHARVDGSYGTQTARAINAFQKENGLQIDGVADAEAQDLLFSEEALEARVFIAPSGKRYHSRKNCRGLKTAKRISECGFSEATGEKDRTPCIFCYGRLALALAMEEKQAPENVDP